MCTGLTCGDDVTHSSVMLELGKCMNVTVAVEMELSVKWHVLGRRRSREGREGGKERRKKGRATRGRGRPRSERRKERDLLVKSHEDVTRSAKGREAGLSWHEEWVKEDRQLLT